MKISKKLFLITFLYINMLTMFVPVNSTSLTFKSLKVNHSATALVPYEGEIWNIFFHSLIVYKDLAFDNDEDQRGYNYWMVTVPEYKRILSELYKNNYILVDINDVYESKTVNGIRSVYKKQLLLPPGKKPLILSLDDINYYDYMKSDGFADKLVLDSNGDVATLTFSPCGERIIARDNDCIPILDTFVENHPDFSHNGAKGIIGLTGYEGILGYRTNNPNSPTYKSDISAVKSIVARLKSTGWRFASHSYGHRHLAKISFERVKRDTDKWDTRVKPLVGETNLYIYPFGGKVSSSTQKFKYLQSKGFDVFFDVNTSPNMRLESNALLLSRTNIDGYRMITGPQHLSPLFDVQSVLDKNRPVINR